MNDSARWATGLALLAALLVWLFSNKSQPRPVAVDEEEDWATDDYLLALVTDGSGGSIRMTSPFPWVGTVWGEYVGVEEDEEE